MKACSGRRGQLDGTGSGREESGASSAGETARVTRRGVLLIPGRSSESSVSQWRPTGVTFALESILQKGRWKGREPASWGSRRETTPAAWKEVTEPELRQGHENRKGQTAPEDVAEAESASPSYRPDVESEEYRMSPKAPASRMEGQAIPSAETGN